MGSVLQVLAATPSELQLETTRLNIRYFTSLTGDATEGSTPTATDNRAGSVPYLFSAGPSRRLLSSELGHPSDPDLFSPAPSKSLPQLPLAARSLRYHEIYSHESWDLEDLHHRLEDHRSRRQLLQTNFVNTSDTEVLWMDLNSDSVVNIEDSLLFADIIKLVDSDPALHCTWLQLSLIHI